MVDSLHVYVAVGVVRKKQAQEVKTLQRVGLALPGGDFQPIAVPVFQHLQVSSTAKVSN